MIVTKIHNTKWQAAGWFTYRHKLTHLKGEGKSCWLAIEDWIHNGKKFVKAERRINKVPIL